MILRQTIGAALLTAFASATSAQLFDQTIVFGDSLFDSGTFPDPGTGGTTGLTFTNRVGPTYLPPEPTAPIAVDILADYLGTDLTSAAAGGTNFAVGGLQTSQILGTVNGYLGSAPTVSASTLYMINGGGNDFLAGLVTDAGSLVGSVNNILLGAQALNAAGANYIAVMNLPDLGLTASAQAGNLIDPTTSAVASAGASNFNGTLETGLNGLGANIIPIDLNGLLALTTSDPGRFNLATGNINIGIADFPQQFMCFDGSAGNCIEHPVFGVNGTAPDPSQLIFNDAIHPTTSATDILAGYLVDIFNAPVEVATLANMGLNTARAQAQAGLNELRLSRWDSDKKRWFAAIDLSEEEFSDGVSAEADNQSISVGFIQPMSEALVLGLGASIGNQEINPNSSQFESSSLGLTGLMGYRLGELFIDSSIALSILDYDSLKRSYHLGPDTITAEGNTDGFAWGLDLLAGYNLLASDSFKLAPTIGLQWFDTRVQGYTENGGEVSNYTWSDINRTSLQWRLGAVAEWTVSDDFRVTAEVFGSAEQKDDIESLRILNTNLNYNAYALPVYQADDSNFVTSSLSAEYKINLSHLRFTWNHSSVGDGFQQLLFSYSRPF